jgi:RHH-type rel operon transcriptional repressor/antitoxin RelB
LYTGDADVKTSTLTVRVASEIEKRLAKLASATARSKSFLAAEAIEEYLAVQEWQVQAILEGKKAAARGEGRDLAQVRKAWEKRREDPSD